mmetsp:Transcript_8288/g.19877  ORF Transcript_8288/g.19877 Transcript_8288/m.19877 type:complete len:260 (-) Transcript_8288:183-962(-)
MLFSSLFAPLRSLAIVHRPACFETVYSSPHSGGLPGYLGYSSLPSGVPTHSEATTRTSASSSVARAFLARRYATAVAARHASQRRSLAPDWTSSNSAGSSISSGDSRSMSIRLEIDPSVSYFFSISSMEGTGGTWSSSPATLSSLAELCVAFACLLLPPPPPPPLAAGLRRRFGGGGGGARTSPTQKLCWMPSGSLAYVSLYISSDSSCCLSSVNASQIFLSVIRWTKEAGSGASSSSSFVARFVSRQVRDGAAVCVSV